MGKGKQLIREFFLENTNWIVMRKTNILFPVAVAALSFLLLPACSTKEEIVEEATYTVEITAVKGSTETRALGLNGNVLSAPWNAGDKVFVFKKNPSVAGGFEQVGNLFATSGGYSTTLTGQLKGTFERGDELRFSYLHDLPFSFTGQNGTLDYIASNCDYAVAYQELKEVRKGAISFAGDLSFDSLQYIVKFTLNDSDGNPLIVNKLSIRSFFKDKNTGEEFDCLVQSFDPKAITNYGGIQVGSIEVTPSSPSNVIFAALANISSGGGLLLEANANGSVYTYTIDSFACLPDNYYLCDVKMTKQE